MSKIANKLCIIGDINCSTTRTYVEYLHKKQVPISKLWLVHFWKKEQTLIKSSIWHNRLADSIRKYVYRDKSVEVVIDGNFSKICLELQRSTDFETIDYKSQWNPSNYCNDVIVFESSSINDDNIKRRIRRNLDHMFLYTNGGIVSEEILNIRNFKMLHVHPGRVPEMKGSDCLLWSAAIRGKLEFSCFFMSPGIDEGDIIRIKEYKIPKIKNLESLTLEYGDEVIYRALLYCIDPHYRADLLSDILRENSSTSWRHLEGQNQIETSDYPYLWIHPDLRRQLINKFR